MHANVVLTLLLLLSDGVGGKTEQGNLEDADSSQELNKLVNGNSKV